MYFRHDKVGFDRESDHDVAQAREVGRIIFSDELQLEHRLPLLSALAEQALYSLIGSEDLTLDPAVLTPVFRVMQDRLIHESSCSVEVREIVAQAGEFGILPAPSK